MLDLSFPLAQRFNPTNPERSPLQDEKIRKNDWIVLLDSSNEASCDTGYKKEEEKKRIIAMDQFEKKEASIKGVRKVGTFFYCFPLFFTTGLFTFIWCMNAYMKRLDPLDTIQKELALDDVPFWNFFFNSVKVYFSWTLLAVKLRFS